MYIVTERRSHFPLVASLVAGECGTRSSRNRKYILRRGGTSAAFAVRWLRRQGSQVLPRRSSILSRPSSFVFSHHFFPPRRPSLLSGLYARTSRRSRKSGDPEMYAVGDVFEALCSDTIGIPAVCSRLSNPSSALVASRNQPITVRYILLSVFLRASEEICSMVNSYDANVYIYFLHYFLFALRATL